MARVQYSEGDWFAVPLRQGGYALGLIARLNQEGILLGYFFGPRHDELPDIKDIRQLRAEDAVLVGRFGHLGLKQGKWPILGRADEWHRKEWPMPIFVRYEELTGRSFKVVYADDDPNEILREEQAAPGVAEQGPKDGLMGSGFVEKVLTGIVN